MINNLKNCMDIIYLEEINKLDNYIHKNHQALIIN